MNVRVKKKRMFGACILLLMGLLTVYVMVFASADDDDSYSLVIEKVFDVSQIDKEAQKDVQAAAESQEYTFLIEGTKRGTDSNGGTEDVAVKEKVTLPIIDDNGKKVWRSEPIKFGVPYNVTVTEITDTIDLGEIKGKHYNMSDSSSNASIPVNSRKHELELKNNSRLTISRPGAGDGENVPEMLWYRVTSRAEDGHSTKDFTPIDVRFTLGPGDSKEVNELQSGVLQAGIYTIEQIAAPSGYRLQLMRREDTVEAGEEGRFYINGTPGSLTLTAGGTAGDGATHYYVVERTQTEEGDESVFVTRNVSIASGEKYILDNLPKGGYTVTEYSIDVNEAFEVTVPQTKILRTLSNLSSAPQYESYRTFSLPSGTSYIRLTSFGPLYDSDKKVIVDDNLKYTFSYGVGNENGNIAAVSIKGTYKAVSTPYLLNNPTARYPDPTNGMKIGFRTQGLKNTAAKYIMVNWTEYSEKEQMKRCDQAGVVYTNGITVGDSGWMRIKAPNVTPGSSGVAYYYTIRNNKGKLITFSAGATDKEGTSIKLQAGKSIKLTGLTPGSYKITETIEWKRVGFTMEITGLPFGTTEAGKEFDIHVGGKRDLTISKPALLDAPEDTTDPRTYTFSVTGPGFSEKVEIQAGESETITLPREGDYKVAPVRDALEVYELKYTDSGAVYGTASGKNASLVFTNVFKAGDYGYRYIHEYYVKEADGTYTYEGNSQVTTRLGCDNQDEIYTAGQIDKVTSFQGNQYTHFGEAYGWVDGIPMPAAQSDPGVEVPADLNGLLPPDAVGEGEKFPEETPSDGEEGKLPEGAPPNGEEGKLPEETPPNGEEGKLPEEAPPDGEEKLPEGAPPNGEEQSPEGEKQEALSMVSYSSGGTGATEKDSEGLISKGTGYASDRTLLNYGPEEGKDHIGVTEDASRIIILRYYRDRQPVGTYNVIHVYYFRDEKGDIREGTSGINKLDGELGVKYTGEGVEKVYEFKPEGADSPYTYTWDGRPQYGVVEEYTGSSSPEDEFADNNMLYRPNNKWTAAEGTEEGNQIIILRYYRERSQEGYYNIVHEYYFRQAGESQDSTEDQTEEAEASPENASPRMASMRIQEDDVSEFNGTLSRNDGYVYTFEGRTRVDSIAAPLSQTYTATKDDWKTSYEKRNYSFIEAGYGSVLPDDAYSCDPHQQWAASTPEGSEIIILRYYREDTKNPPDQPQEPKPEDPTPPDDPDPRDPPGGPETPPRTPETPPETPETPPETPETPPETPETPPETPPEDPETPPETPETPPENPESPPENPEQERYLTELPDPNAPDCPETVTIWEDGVPKTYVRIWDPESEEWVWVPEDEIPRGSMEAPRTGDDSWISLWTALAAGSLCGLVLLASDRRKRTEN